MSAPIDLQSLRRPALHVRRLGIDTYREPIVYLRRDSPVCRSEGLEAQARVLVRSSRASLAATLNVLHGELLSPSEIGVSEIVFERLRAEPGELVELTHARPLESMSDVRRKVYGGRLDDPAFERIVRDVAQGCYTDVELSALVTACAGTNLDLAEIAGLTRAMREAGETLRWDVHPVVDKHSVGGLPGNRTTPIVVPIVAACGLTMPKTSSRAITSAAGTADVMETLAPVDLDLPALRRVVEREGACIVWGGSVRLSPADDVLIRVERVLDLDSDGQLVASVMSKKAAAGSTHVVIDIPVGPTAKVRDGDTALRLGRHLRAVGSELGMKVRIVQTDGDQPVGHGIGPALEARDVLAVLRGDASAPRDLRARALLLASALLECAGHAAPGEGESVARGVLESGRAHEKLLAICEVQGGLRKPPVAAHTHDVLATREGIVLSLDNRRLARIAKLAGAPSTAAAGIDLHVKRGDRIDPGQPLFTIHADAPGELAYALDYARRFEAAIAIGEPGEA